MAADPRLLEGCLSAPGPRGNGPGIEPSLCIATCQLPRRRDAFQRLQSLHGCHGPEGRVVNAGGVEATARLTRILLKIHAERFILPLWSK
jgi:hypothetical protein